MLTKLTTTVALWAFLANKLESGIVLSILFLARKDIVIIVSNCSSCDIDYCK